MLHQLRTARALLASDPRDAIGTAAVLVLFAIAFTATMVILP